MTTLQQIYTEIYYILWEKTTSTIFPLNTVVIPMVNRVQDLVCKGHIVDETTGRTIKGGDLRFLYKEMFIQGVEPQKTTAAIAVLDGVIDIDTTDFASSGYVWINGNVIKYTGKTSTQLTGVTGIEIAQDSWQLVYQIREIPSTASKVLDLRYLNDNYTVENIDWRGAKNLPYYWSRIYDNVNTDKSYVFIYGYDSQDKFKLVYYVKSTDMVNDSDETNLPDNYGITVLSNIVAGKLLRKTSELKKATWILQEWYANLVTMYVEYAEQKKKFREKVKTKPFDNYRTVGDTFYPYAAS